MNNQNMLDELKNGIVNFDEAKVMKYSRKILSDKADILDAIENGLSAGMKVIGERFENGEAFLPELIRGAELFEKAMNLLEEVMLSSDIALKKVGTVVMGTVKGDIHNIGKDILGMLLKVRGFNIVDLGVDVATMDFLKNAQSKQADIICMSSLLTTTMPSQKEVIDFLIEKGVREDFIVMVGGGPVSKQWADEIGADGYAETAEEGTNLAISLLEKKKSGSA